MVAATSSNNAWYHPYQPVQALTHFYGPYRTMECIGVVAYHF
jgi:hypothetical protein